MSRFQVLWSDEAEDSLIRLWLEYEARSEITTAIADADRLLASDPLSAGVIVSEGLRKLITESIIVIYSVEPDDLTVFVAQVAVRRK